MHRIITLFLIQLTLVFSGCAQKPSPKINGVSFVAAPNEAVKEHVDALVNIQANYAALMPFGFLKSVASTTIIHNTDRQWFGETEAGLKQYASVLKKEGIGIMVKPQIWVRGAFTGHIKMQDEQQWLLLENAYKDFILVYAKAAEEIDAEILCIGTELEQFVVNRPQFWDELIVAIKKVYKGKLTYAANWDEYKRVPFWGALDYIGVDAYFPISNEKTPTIAQAKSGLQSWKQEMQQVAQVHNKPILFTEYGYRSVDYAGKEPWNSDHTLPGVNMDAQTNLTKAIIEEMYPQQWFAGGFIWKWFIDHNNVGGMQDNQYTPQNKPVEQELKKYFTKYTTNQ